MSELKITVLIENESECNTLHAEHGLALYLRYNDYNILLDAGQSGIFAENAAALGCPLNDLDAVVLSHGHLDHADGFPALFQVNDTIKVHARTTVFLPRYNETNGRYSGVCDIVRDNYAHRFDLSDEAREILPGVWLVPDDVDHEQSLVVETQQGLVVMNSCCHAGGDDIVADILKRFPGKKVCALIGGLHLMGPDGVTTLGKTPEQVRALALRLTGELGVDKIYTGHCTGAPAMELLHETVPGRICHIHTGHILEF